MGTRNNEVMTMPAAKSFIFVQNTQFSMMRPGFADDEENARQKQDNDRERHPRHIAADIDTDELITSHDADQPQIQKQH